jgi:hypothetical protein
MSLGIAIKGPEGVVLAADSRAAGSNPENGQTRAGQRTSFRHAVHNVATAVPKSVLPVLEAARLHRPSTRATLTTAAGGRASAIRPPKVLWS